MVRFLERRGDSLESAQDAAQEAFVRLWQYRERWSSGSAKALLYRMALNISTDRRRTAATRRQRRAEMELAEPEPPSTPEHDLESREAEARFTAALEALPKRRREVFQLVRHDGLSYREIAHVLELSPQTVANHMSMALADLRAALADLLTPAASGSESHDQTGSNDG